MLSLFEQSFEYEAGRRVSNLHHTRPLSEALTGGPVGLRFSDNNVEKDLSLSSRAAATGTLGRLCCLRHLQSQPKALN